MLIVEKRAELKPSGLSQKTYYSILTVSLVALILIGYSFTVNSFFVADDYFLLHTAQGGWFPFSRGDFPFYRPLTLLIWFWQYQLVGFSSPFFYHLLNLSLHLINCVLLAALANLLAGNRRYGWLAAMLFCVYPLHPEAVTWLAGRFDLLSTTVQLLSFIFLLKFYQSLLAKSRYWWLVGSLATYFAALLCKESALFLPLVVGIYLILAGKAGAKSWKQTLIMALPVFAAFLVVTGLYLGLRVAVLQSLDGGEPISYNLLNFIVPTIEALKVLLAPVNEVLLAKHFVWKDLLLVTCGLICTLSLLGALFKVRKSKDTILLIVVGLSWSVLAIEPAQAVDYVRNAWQLGYLENSRVLYPASAGLCLVLAVGLWELANVLPPPNKFFRRKYFANTLIFSIIVFYLAVLLINNSAWATAGQQAQTVEQSFGRVVALAQSSGHNLTQPADGVGVVIEGLPDNYAGAYVGRNMFDSLTKVFYNLKVPAYSVNIVPDFSKVDFKTLYIAKYALFQKQLTLTEVDKLDKNKPIQVLYSLNISNSK